MDVTSNTAAATSTKTSTSTKTDSSATEPAAKNKLNGDFETFLRLLTTQLQNQDPLDPTDSTEFVGQLANFSSVEQQVQTNTKLDSMISALGASSATRAADFIGKEVLAPGSVTFTGAPVEIGMTPVTSATAATLVVKNDFGKTAATLSIPPGGDTVTWDGTDGAGKILADGTYKFEISSYDGSKNLLGQQDGTVYSKVKEVRVTNGSPMLVLQDGSQVGLDTVTALR